MTDTSWTDRFDIQTVGGFPWRSSESFSSQVNGEVYRRDGWQLARWIVLPNGNLYCPVNRENNINMLIAPTPPRTSSSPTRLLDTDFIVSIIQDAYVSYTVELVASVSLLGLSSDEADVDLQINGIAIMLSRNALTATLALGTAFTHTHRKVLTAYVPRGNTVRLVSSGTGSSTLVSAQEVLL